MNEITTFLGESVEYWIELKKKTDSLGVSGIMRELVQANAKVRYYETHLQAMSEFKKAAER